MITLPQSETTESSLVSIPTDLALYIASFLKITDKRRLTRTCRSLDFLVRKLIKLQEETLKIKNFIYSPEYKVEKFTLELCNDGYFSSIPQSYLQPTNSIIIKAVIIYGQLDLLHIAISNGCEFQKNGHDFERDNCGSESIRNNSSHHAILSGDLEILKFTIKQGCFVNFETFNLAVKYDNLPMLQYLIDIDCNRTNGACEIASECGNIPRIEWLLSNGFSLTEKSCRSAAYFGQFETLKWLRSKMCPWDEKTCTYSAEGGNVDILKYAIDNGCPYSVKKIYFGACRNNYINVIKFMQDRGFPLNKEACNGAAQGGHAELLEYLIDNSFPYSLKNIYYNACKYNRINIVKWMQSRNFPWHEKACAGAANGNFGLLKYLREQNCDWGTGVYLSALRSRNVHIAEWAIENGCYFSKAELLSKLHPIFETDIMEWVNNHNCG
jgi:hypothetical protein